MSPTSYQAALPRDIKLVPETGVEPARDFSHGILSPGRLPIPPLRPVIWSLFTIAHLTLFVKRSSQFFQAGSGLSSAQTQSAMFLFVHRPATADELRPGPSAQQDGLADMVQTQPHRNSHIPQMHTDHRAPNIQPRMSPDMLHRHWGGEAFPGGGGKGASRLWLGYHAHRVIAVLPGAVPFQDQRPVQVFTALGGQPDSPLLERRIDAGKHCLRRLQTGGMAYPPAYDLG